MRGVTWHVRSGATNVERCNSGLTRAEAARSQHSATGDMAPQPRRLPSAPPASGEPGCHRRLRKHIHHTNDIQTPNEDDGSDAGDPAPHTDVGPAAPTRRSQPPGGTPHVRGGAVHSCPEAPFTAARRRRCMVGGRDSHNPPLRRSRRSADRPHGTPTGLGPGGRLFRDEDFRGQNELPDGLPPGGAPSRGKDTS